MSDDIRQAVPPIAAIVRWFRRPWVDVAAASVSILCLLHCIVPPLLILLFPLLAYEIDLPESTHVVLLAVAVPLSLIALRQGLADHGRLVVVILGVTGQLLVFGGVLSEEVPLLETGLTIVGVSLVALVHAFNWRARRRNRIEAQAIAAA
jgi:hypothetical protein